MKTRVNRTFRFALAISLVAVLSALSGATVPAIAQKAEDGGDGRQELRNLSKPRYDQAVVEEYRIPTSYGTIYGWVKRPVVPEGVQVPVILTYSPYAVIESPAPGRERIYRSESETTTGFFVPRGYARAFFHLVGTGNSGGCYDYGGIRERSTAREVVEFLARRSWSNQRVGMIGGSYDGTTQWAAAVEAPPHLTTIIPQVAITRWYDYAYGQGVRFASGSGTPLLFDVGFNQIPIPTYDPLAPGMREALMDSLRPCETLQHQIRGFGPDPVYDGFWDERDYLTRADRVEASVLFEGSWVDYNVHPVNTIQMWHALPQRVTKMLVMGQQGHGTAGFENSQKVRHAWLDHWLRGRSTGVLDLPAVDSQVNTGERFKSEQWPPAGTRETQLPLVHEPGEDALVLEEGDSPEWTDADPQLDEDTVLAGLAPAASALFLDNGAGENIRIAGTPVLDARLTTSAESTYVTPVLFDESPDGSRTVITRGLLNSRNRSSLRETTPLAPGEVWRARARFQPTDYVLRKGHRLGLAIMSMNSDEALYADETRATNELKLDGRSVLSLPVSSQQAHG